MSLNNWQRIGCRREMRIQSAVIQTIAIFGHLLLLLWPGAVPFDEVNQSEHDANDGKDGNDNSNHNTSLKIETKMLRLCVAKIWSECVFYFRDFCTIQVLGGIYIGEFRIYRPSEYDKNSKISNFFIFSFFGLHQDD